MPGILPSFPISGYDTSIDALTRQKLRSHPPLFPRPHLPQHRIHPQVSLIHPFIPLSPMVTTNQSSKLLPGLLRGLLTVSVIPYNPCPHHWNNAFITNMIAIPSA